MMRIGPKVFALVVVVAAIAYFLLRTPFQTADDFADTTLETQALAAELLLALQPSGQLGLLGGRPVAGGATSGAFTPDSFVGAVVGPGAGGPATSTGRASESMATSSGGWKGVRSKK